MPILSDLSRRFHMLTMLTTDAKPDPSRVVPEGYTHNLNPGTTNGTIKTKKSSRTESPESRLNDHNSTSTQPDKTLPNNSIPTKEANSDGATTPSSTNTKEQKRPNVKTKTKSRQYKYSQGTNVVNYNIINSNGVKIGSRTSYICNVNQYPASNTPQSEGPWSKPKFRDMPEDVERLSGSTEEISFEDMFIIKTHVGHGWRDLARRLSYSDGQIDQFEENYRFRGVDEVIYQLLLDWKQANTKDAEIGTLVNILWTCQEYDCAERLVAVHTKTA